MSSKAHADRLAKALEQTNLCKVVLADFKGDQIRLLLRLAQGADQKWIQLIDRILLAGEVFEGGAVAWQSHICKNYFRKDMDDGTKKLVFGWYVSIQSNSMTQSLDEIVKAIRGTVPKRSETEKALTMEMPLGINHELNVPNENGKGAYVVGGKQSFKPFK